VFNFLKEKERAVIETACLEVNVVKSLLKRARGDNKPTKKSGGKT